MRKVSILIPTYNRAHMIRKAIDSSLSQTYQCEIVVCDHGSTDNTPAVMEEYTNKVKYIRRDTDFGPHFCWLEGVLNCTSEFIHIQYDDDWIDKSYIEKMLCLIDESVGFSFSQVSICNNDGEIQRELFSNVSNLFKTGIHSTKMLEKMLANGLMISPGACLFRRQAILDALYQGDLLIKPFCNYHGAGPDHLMTFSAIMRYKKFGFNSESLSFFREHAGSITVDAGNSLQCCNQLKATYERVKCYYKLLRLYNNSKLLRVYIFLKDRNVMYFKHILKTTLCRIGNTIKKRFKSSELS